MRETTTVILSEMAGRLSEEFNVTIANLTPYDWWKRTKDESISVLLPVPIRFVGRSPIFLWRDVKRWYLMFKGED
ncbi:hypothetical protein LCGC14_1334040 [marine sediment metagenome]|uniref:Uncharacterized protein n=1 Tax=marine sediment metagenome TaxID=412755 RepID=A0A0F9KGD8_9ZZZZ